MADRQVRKNTIFADMREVLRFPFVIAILGIVVCFCFDNWETLKACINNPIIYGENSSICVLYFFFNSFSFGGVFTGYFSSLLAAVPFAANYSHEHQGGMTAYKITRSGKRTYAFSKIFVAALSGGTVMLIGSAIFIAALSAFFPLVTTTALLDFQAFPYAGVLSTGNGGLYFAVALYLAFISGALWGCCGICISAFFPNQYVAICSPMFVCFLIVEVGRLANLPDWLRLDRMLNARGLLFSEPITLIALAVLIVAIGFLCFKLFLRRVTERLDEVERC